ncbi:hypothetical protein Hanom_Chr12g01102131 [Helianthus anomalus]
MCSRSVIFVLFVQEKNGKNEKNSDLDPNIQICAETSVGFYVFHLSTQVIIIKNYLQSVFVNLQIYTAFCVLDVLDIFITRKMKEIQLMFFESSKRIKRSSSVFEGSSIFFERSSVVSKDHLSFERSSFCFEGSFQLTSKGHFEVFEGSFQLTSKGHFEVFEGSFFLVEGSTSKDQLFWFERSSTTSKDPTYFEGTS